jgi:hypothetical protein
VGQQNFNHVSDISIAFTQAALLDSETGLLEKVVERVDADVVSWEVHGHVR